MKHLIVTLSFVFFINGSAVFADETPYSIRQAFEDVLTNDARIAAAEAALRSAQEATNQASGLTRPNISGFGSASFSEQKQLNDFGTSQQDGYRATAGIEVNQPLFSFGRYSAKRQEAAAHVALAQARRDQITSGVILDTAKAYFDVLKYQEIQALYADHHKNMTFLLEVTEAKFQSDLTTATDVRLVRSRMEQADAERISASADLQSATDLLARLTGNSSTTLVRNSLGEILSLDLPDRDESLELAFINSHKVRIAQAEEIMAQAELEYSKSDLWPQAGIRGRSSRGVLDGRVIGSDEIGLTLTVPLYDGGIARSKERANRYGYDEARQNLRRAQDEIFSSVTAAWNNFQGSTQSYNAWQRAVTSELETIEGIQEEVDENLRPITHLLEAKEEMINTQSRAINIFYESRVARVALEDRIGTLVSKIVNHHSDNAN